MLKMTGFFPADLLVLILFLPCTAFPFLIFLTFYRASALFPFRLTFISPFSSSSSSRSLFLPHIRSSSPFQTSSNLHSPTPSLLCLSFPSSSYFPPFLLAFLLLISFPPLYFFLQVRPYIFLLLLLLLSRSSLPLLPHCSSSLYCFILLPPASSFSPAPPSFPLPLRLFLAPPPSFFLLILLLHSVPSS